ncbi:MAG: hypothetical protein PHI23_03355 [Candidatus Peribacteraceae bacterium]|nr:hypothetical protein [Candidatus Peribacteraceae bacterium]
MIVLIVLVTLAVLASAFVLVSLRFRRRLPPGAQARLRGQWEHVFAVADPRLRILEAEKVLDELLRLLGFQGSFADKLRAAGPLLRDREAVWQAHKLRNRIAHETGFSVSEGEARHAVHVFEQALKQFVK